MRRTLITAITLVSAAAMTSGAGLALASTSASPSSTRHERFRIIGTSETAKRQSVIATGSFQGGGSEALGKTLDKVDLYKGSFEVTRHVTFRTPPAPPSGCIVRVTERGTYRLGHGTGRYAGIRGTGTFASRITIVLARTGSSSCGATVAFQQITYESGTVNK
jgi:hypothetical protein